jgi:hypothetical protein
VGDLVDSEPHESGCQMLICFVEPVLVAWVHVNRFVGMGPGPRK